MIPKNLFKMRQNNSSDGSRLARLSKIVHLQGSSAFQSFASATIVSFFPAMSPKSLNMSTRNLQTYILPFSTTQKQGCQMNPRPNSTSPLHLCVLLNCATLSPVLRPARKSPNALCLLCGVAHRSLLFLLPNTRGVGYFSVVLDETPRPPPGPLPTSLARHPICKHAHAPRCTLIRQLQ